VAPSLAGLAKAGRWLPVRVLVDHAGGDLAGELVVTWGRRELRRSVSLRAGDRRQIDLHIRALDSVSPLRVQLVAGGVVQSVDTQLRMLPHDEPVTLCVASPDGAVPRGASCTAIAAAAELPRSPRGYDIVDDIVWSDPQAFATMTTSQRDAIEQWEALRRLDRTGDLGLTPGVTRPMLARGLPADTATLIAALVAACIAGLVCCGLAFQRSRVALLLVALGTVTTAGMVGAYGVGRTGPATSVVLYHESLLQQLPGTRRSLLTTEGIAVFPAFDRYALRLALIDATLDTASATGRVEHVDEEGHPVLTGVFGLGDRQAFAAEAFVPAQLLDVAESGDTLRVTNVSNSELRECRFADGFSLGGAHTLRPSASLEARRGVDVAGPALTCDLSGSVAAFTESRRTVQDRGRTRVAVYLTSHRGPGDD
jgi:hypothetical protein